jgi:hypothetical protein
MIQTGFEKRVKVQQIIESQLPEFILSESPKTLDFLKQYYISQEYQGGPSDLSENLDQYLKLDNLTPEVISGQTNLSTNVSSTAETVEVTSTKGFPAEYGLFKIGDEIITYTGITTNSFTGCIRGFCGITSYRTDLDAEELIFENSSAESHVSGTTVENLSTRFLKEFYNKLKYSFTPGLENVDFVSDLDVNNFIKEARSLYEAKGTEDSYKILFKVLYGVEPKVIDLEEYLVKPSSASFARRDVIIAERISGDPNNLVGQIVSSTDSQTKASVSEVEIFTRSGISTYYKIGLFIGFDERDLIEGTFEIQASTKVISAVPVGSSVITVDSTVGFPNSGKLISGENTIEYTEKTVNQFLGCTGVEEEIGTKSSIRTDTLFVGYENGDITKKVELRITGVLSKFEPLNDILDATEGERIYTKNVGERILNPETDKTNKEIFANSWVYNTSSRFEVESISGSTFQLKSELDKSSLKVGDTVDILNGTTETVIHSGAVVGSLNAADKQITLDNLIGFSASSSVVYTIRRKIETASSSGSPIFYGNNIITSDIQNIYTDRSENAYVASNSLPSYNITESVLRSTLPSSSGSALQGYNSTTEKYSVLSFSNIVPFITGDEVYYTYSESPLNGLSEGYYYVKVLPLANQIKLYASRSLIVTDNPVEFTSSSATGSHTFTISSQKSGYIYPQKLLKKFPLSRNVENGTESPTLPAPIGMLSNGVEIVNYKSTDKIYYGPIEKVRLYDGGTDYDVITPPDITISSPGAGYTTSLCRPIIEGNVKEVYVDPQDFDLVDVLSVTIDGGNGAGAILEPVLETRYREIEFDGRLTSDSGGIDNANDTITFLKSHNLRNGDAIVYNRNGNTAIGVGTFGGSNAYQNLDLNSGSVYYAQIVNSSTIKLYETFENYTSGINTVGFTTTSQGIHKFRMFDGRKNLKSIKVINPGSGYQNRQLKVKPENISTVESSITFKNHGFSDGDVVVYTTDGSAVTGLTTSVRYKVLKVSDDTFRLANVGVGATDLTNYTKRLPVSITGSGSGFQNFAYPDISVTVNAEFDGVTGIITATPVIRGEIIDVYLYETGTGYGSSILNFHKKPDISVKSGKDVELKPNIFNGSIISVQVTNAGSEYTSAPDLKVIGDGIGARLRAIVSGGKVTNVVVLNSGKGYSQNTTINATSIGKNAIVDVDVRSLTLNNHYRFGNEILFDSNEKLGYGVVGYTTSVGRSEFGDGGSSHSPIIGWAYDGNPIYGAYAYSDPSDIDSDIKILSSGYEQSTGHIVDRPTDFVSGFFVEDYKFTSSGDLDEHNGRYAKTPEFPNGVYAYHAAITSDGKNSKFPYFIGNTYRSIPVIQNLDQGYDFNNSSLIRNTFPYKVGDSYANNDFIIESYKTLMQSAVIDSIIKSSVDGFTINEPGSGYRVNDIASFDNTDTNGGGLSAYVERVTGKLITDITTNVQTYQSNVLVWDNPNQVSVHVDPSHTFLNGDQISISGLSTFVSGLTKIHKVGVTSESTKLVSEVAANSTVGFVTDIFVTSIPSSVSAGTTVAIGTERLSVLKTYPENKVIRVIRGISGSAHTSFTDISFFPSSFTLPVKTSHFDSNLDDKVFFNSIQSVGVGTTTGSSSPNQYLIGNTYKTVSVPVQSVYLPNHPFKTGQQVTFERVSGSQGFTVSTEEGNTTFTIPQSGNTETLFVVKKSPDFIGLCTQVGLTTNTEGLYFRSITSNGDSTDYRYSLKSNKTQVTARAEKIKATVSVSTAHGLDNGDIINLSLNSEQSVGIGTSVSVYLKYNSSYDRLLVNPIGFNSTAINTSTNELTLIDHGFKTGDKVFYNASDLVASGLSTGSYFVYKIDDDTINLSPTHYDSISTPPTIVSLGSTGGSSQELSSINPQLNVFKDNNLIFNVSDTSLSGYTLKLFYDKEFKNELVSIGSSTTFSTSGVGTVGVTTTASFTLNYHKDLPSKVYYQLDKAGFISTADIDVKNYNEILFNDSVYNGTYSISGVAATTFDISLSRVPEDLQYNQSNTSILKYSTSSLRALGGVDSMRITFGGANYKKLPKFVSIASTAGENADIIPTSTTLGRINQVTIQDPGFDFSADKTLSPEVYISPNITVRNRNIISDIEVTSGGSGYTSVPDLVIVNPSTGTAYDSGLAIAKVQGSSISSVEIVESPRGISDLKSKIFSVNNSNGVGVNSIFSSQAGVVTCVLSTPVNGFTAATAPFSVGDFVFSEGVSLASTTGTGFNSADYSYNFFEVTAYRNTNPAEVEFDISPYASNAGVAHTNQNSLAFLINKNNYPTFNVIQAPDTFIIGETLFTKSGNTYVERDLIITNNLNDSIKVYGTYTLSVGEIVVGKDSGAVATIKSIVENKGIFKVNYGLETDYGWSSDTGKLNEDYQVISDNDYYQNLSYSIKSPIEYEDWVDPVNRLLHSSGLKNFADTEITSKSNISIGTSESSTTISLIDINNVNDDGTTMRVDAINFFDFGIDVDVSSDRSKFVKLQNQNLSDYIECRTNRVLTIDNFNNLFSNAEDANTTLYKDIDSFIANDGYSRYFIQIINPNNNDRQATEIVVLNTPSDDLITVEKNSIHNSQSRLVDIQATKDANGNSKLRLIPADPYNDDYDVKFVKTNFNTTLAGINTQSVGFVNLVGSNVIVGSGSTTTVFEQTTSTTEALFAIVELSDTITKDKVVVDMFIDHDGTNTYKSDFFFDNNVGSELSNRFIGTFTSSINSDVLSLKFENTESNNVLVRSSIVGFGTTATGIGTYIFKASGQPDSSVKEGRLETEYSIFSGSGISTVLSYTKADVTTVKTTARVSYGNTSALHQIVFNHNNNNTFTVQSPYLSIDSTTGIGTFGSEISGDNFNLIFYPDANINDDILIQSYNEIIQTEKDLLNIPTVLSYGTVNQKLVTEQFNSINGDRTNKYDFDLNHNGTPIFEKEFNPSSSSVVDLGNGTFTISDHFFSTGENLTYTPRSSFVGGAYTSMVMSDTNILPSEVFAIKINNDQFKLATSKSNANAGTAVTFNSAGTGNAHTLEMNKKMEKSLITIDGVTRAPLAFTPINYTLSDNGGSIAVGSTYFGVSGISSILPGDVLRIDDEYVKVNAVGLGTTTVGPITGSGSFNVIKTERGFVGTLATTHTDGTTVRVYQGSFNMTRSKIHFTEVPRGNNQELVDESNIPYHKSTFGGRVYLRQDYSTNQIYDNITRQFTGIGATYRLTVGGANTTGIETGSGLLFINNMFQTPTTVNNTGGNYSFIENAGISSVVFGGVNNNTFISDYDVNQNQLPRGGLIVSLGSTQGLGFAPLVGASVTAFVAGGVIQSVGLGSTDILGSGYRGTVSIGVTDPNHTGDAATITATVGAGGTLSFTISGGGTGYSDNPIIEIPEPSYENLPIIGVSRLGIGNTTDTGSGLLLNVEVGAATTNVGIGSTLFEVKNFKITRPGWGFRKGDKFKPVGLVTAKNLSSPINDFELEVLEVFSDNFAAWQFGELDFIDPIAGLQNGIRTRFPLKYNGDLLSFEVDRNNSDSANINLESLLLIYINGIVQEPNINYVFEGGTSIVFTEAPKSSDNIEIFFYRGTRNTDSVSVNVNETIKVGDIIQLQKNGSSVIQDPRTIYNINASDKIETNIYTGFGIDETNFKPFSWAKQKVDKNLGGELVYKSRDSIESQVYPTAKIIGDLSTSATEIFVDNAQFFNYEENESSINITSVDGLIVNTTIDPVAAAITAVVSTAGTISSFTITSGGSGYVGASTDVKISAPKAVGVGVGTTATATATITNGSISSISITNAGFGYTHTAPPQVLTPLPKVSVENLSGITAVAGFAGTITGIGTTVGTGGNPIALKFTLSASSFTGLQEGYPIYVFNTSIGYGVTSINDSDSSVVSIGTTFLDNIYIINSLHTSSTTGVATCNVISTAVVTGLSTSGSVTDPRGYFSWGKLSGFSRASSPISIGVTGLTVDSGLSTFPTIQRRGYGLRDGGALRKDLG